MGSQAADGGGALQRRITMTAVTHIARAAYPDLVLLLAFLTALVAVARMAGY